jgi:hypothetical protein
MEYDVQHPVPVSSMLMFGDIYPRAGAGHYYVNAGLTETNYNEAAQQVVSGFFCKLPFRLITV